VACHVRRRLRGLPCGGTAQKLIHPIQYRPTVPMRELVVSNVLELDARQTVEALDHL
jgi:hypothetical protein